jgi:hypothetical protein
MEYKKFIEAFAAASKSGEASAALEALKEFRESLAQSLYRDGWTWEEMRLRTGYSNSSLRELVKPSRGRGRPPGARDLTPRTRKKTTV